MVKFEENLKLIEAEARKHRVTVKHFGNGHIRLMGAHRNMDYWCKSQKSWSIGNATEMRPITDILQHVNSPKPQIEYHGKTIATNPAPVGDESLPPWEG